MTINDIEEMVNATSKGPWRITRSGRYVSDAVGAPHICEVDTRKLEWEANARFIGLSKEIVKFLLDEIWSRELLLAEVHHATWLNDPINNDYPDLLKRIAAVVTKGRSR